jgi:DNA gyrase subunit A
MESLRAGSLVEAIGDSEGEAGEEPEAPEEDAVGEEAAADTEGADESEVDEAVEKEPAACPQRPAAVAAEADETTAVLTVCANGYGKRTPVGEYRSQHRGGKGLIDIKTTDRNGPVVGQLLVREVDHIMLISDGGTVLRCRVREISCIGRNTQGVRITRLREDEHIVAVEKLVEASDGGDSLPPPPEPGSDGSGAGPAGDVPPAAGGTDDAEGG